MNKNILVAALVGMLCLGSVSLAQTDTIICNEPSSTYMQSNNCAFNTYIITSIGITDGVTYSGQINASNCNSVYYNGTQNGKTTSFRCQLSADSSSCNETATPCSLPSSGCGSGDRFMPVHVPNNVVGQFSSYCSAINSYAPHQYIIDVCNATFAKVNSAYYTCVWNGNRCLEKVTSSCKLQAQ